MKFDVIFCIPGKDFTQGFFDSWTNLLQFCARKKIDFAVSRFHDACVQAARTKCLAPELDADPVIPFGGKVDYDYLMWIDTDMVFEPEQFFDLLAHDVDIVSGAAKSMDGEFTYRPLGGKQEGKLIKCAYNGMFWMLIKKGVFEKIEYPWFLPMQEGKLMIGEDASFCRRARHAGFDVFCDPKIVIGHQKEFVI